MNFDDATPDEVLKAFLVEKRRLSCAISSTGIDDNGRMPSHRPIQDWESLNLLTRGISELHPQAWVVLEVKLFGFSHVEWVPQAEYPKGMTRDEWESLPDNERPPHKSWQEQQTFGLTTREVAKHCGLKIAEVRELISAAYDTVEEHLIRLRSREHGDER